MCPFSRLLEIRVVEDEERGLAAGFEGDVFEVYGCGFHDLTACGGGASEGDFVNARVGGEGGAGDLAVAVEKVEDAGWETGFFYEVGEVEDTEGGLFCCLEDYGVPACERWANLPCHHC